MNGLEYIQRKQVAWAIRKCLNPVGSTFQNEGKKNYLENLDDNLFKALTDETLTRLNDGDGKEAEDKKNGIRAKINALHSSCAIVVNTFQYWHNKDVYPILRACKLCAPSRVFSAGKIKFEEKFEISSSFRYPPNIDIIIDDSQSQIYAIESKFTEPYSSKKPKGISERYIDNVSFWSGLSNLYDLAKEICPDNNRFQHLDAAQLIKHVLGLKKTKKRFRLLYLWYDVIGKEGAEHRKEIEQFAEIANRDIKFHHITYQEVIMNLIENFYTGNEKYCDYLSDRYL
ncbi:MAG: hypothetical protein FWC50_07065 [Planctomycetaceae bacterium]|nr:hypothetical protein [Planctomycetaceae bacterium]